MTAAEMDSDLMEAEVRLARTRFRVARSKHRDTTETTLWVFDGTRQIGVAAREPTCWRASHMRNGMPTSSVHTPTLDDALTHIMQREDGR